MCSSAFSFPSVVLYSILSAVCTETLSTIIPYFLIFHISPSSLLNHFFFIFLQLLKACHDKAVLCFKDFFVVPFPIFSMLLQTKEHVSCAGFFCWEQRTVLCVRFVQFVFEASELQGRHCGEPAPHRSTERLHSICAFVNCAAVGVMED